MKTRIYFSLIFLTTVSLYGMETENPQVIDFDPLCADVWESVFALINVERELDNTGFLIENLDLFETCDLFHENPEIRSASKRNKMVVPERPKTFSHIKEYILWKILAKEKLPALITAQEKISLMLYQIKLKRYLLLRDDSTNKARKSFGFVKIKLFSTKSMISNILEYPEDATGAIR